MYINTCKDIYLAFKSGNSSNNIESLQDINKTLCAVVIISGIALLFIFRKQLVNIFIKHKYIYIFLVIVVMIVIPVLLSHFKIIGDPFQPIMSLPAAIFAIPPFVQSIKSSHKEKREESGIQKNVSKSSPEFIQENSPTTIQENSPASIQNNSPISIQNNNNSPISIQNIINTTDERSERERNTAKACEILASKDSTSRISAVKTLANIADSWLEDSPNCKKDEKKYQDIIEILCAYIKSPFDLVYRRQNLEYSQRLEDMEDQSKLLAEQTVRRTIFEVISRQIDKYCKSDDSSYPTNPRLSKIWEEVDLDFSYAHIFYSLDNLTLKNAKFNYSHFFGDANFNHSTFKGKTYFQGAKFYNDVSFEETTFEGDVDFSSADFQKPHLDQVDSLATMIKSSQKHPLGMHNADALYKHLRKKRFAPPGKTVFYESKFYGAANFQCTLFYGWADFQEAEFHEDVEFLSFVYKGLQFEQARFNYKKETDFFFLPKDRRQNMLKPQKYIEIEKLIPIESILFDPDSEKNK